MITKTYSDDTSSLKAYQNDKNELYISIETESDDIFYSHECVALDLETAKELLKDPRFHIKNMEKDN